MKLNLVQRPLWNILLTNHEKLKNQDFMDRVSLHSRSKMKKPLDKIYFYVKKKKIIKYCRNQDSNLGCFGHNEEY